MLLPDVPLLVGVMWLLSGRPVFTSSGRAVEVLVSDPLFGDALPQTRFVPGPIFGYYVGLDLLIATVLLALAAGVIWWWLGRRQRRRVSRVEENPHAA